MKKFSKALFSLLLLCVICFFVSCKTKEPDEPSKGDEPTIELRKALDNIELDTASVKKDYYLGQTFDSTGLKVTANFTNNTTEDVTSNAVIDSKSFDTNALGQYLIIVSYTYEGRVRTNNFSVNVKTILENNIKHLVGLDVITDPIDKKFEYSIGEEVDLTGVSLSAVYSDKTTTVLTLEDVSVDKSGIDKTKAGNYLVVFSLNDSYTFEGVTQEVTVKNFLLVSYINPVTKIEFKSGTIEVDYGSDFVTTDWVIEATYSNSDTAVIPLGNYSVSKVNTNLSGEQTVVVTYTEMGVTRTCNVKITIGEDPNAEKPLKVILDTSELEVVNGVTEDIVINPYFTIKGSSSKTLRVDANSKTFGDLSFTKRINFAGQAGPDGRTIAITMPKAGKIRVIFSQGNPGRKVGLWNSGFTKLSESDNGSVDNNTLVEHIFTVDSEGVYFIGSVTSGIYIWYVEIEA